jgi:predicted nucleic acid-binding protein
LDQGAPGKREQAIDWLTALAGRNVIVISPQVLNETASVLVHKLKADVAALRETVDCLIVASALDMPCDCLLTEDLPDGQNLGDLRIINPFLHPVERVLGPS